MISEFDMVRDHTTSGVLLLRVYSMNMKVALIAALLCGCALWQAAPTPGLAEQSPVAPGTTGRFESEGITIDFSMHPLAFEGGWTRPPRQGDDVVFRFSIADVASATPLAGANPAAWMGLRVPGETVDADRCAAKISQWISGSIFATADLDLNVYYVLALNEDATITVVDPLFGFGGTKLLAMVELQSPGEDWALNANESKLFVSLPESDRIAVITTADWRVLANIDVGNEPRRLGLQPDGEYLWVEYEGTSGVSGGGGVAAISAATHEVVTQIATGIGPHQLAFSDDNRFVFVTNRGSGTMSIIDVGRLAKVADIEVGGRPSSIDFSPLSQMTYVVDELSGSIAVIDGERQRIITRMQAQPGLGQIKFIQSI